MLKRRGPKCSFLGAHHRSLGAIFLSLSGVGLWGCSATSGQDPKVPPASDVSPPEHKHEAEPSPEPEPESRAADLFKRGQSYETTFSSELMTKPTSQFSRAALASVPIPIAASATSQLWLAVDQNASRLASPKKQTIVDLLTEDVELAPGAHWLVAWGLGADEKLSTQTHAFFVEVEAQGLPRAPGCLLTTPVLTVNGPQAAQSVTFMALPLMAGIDRVEYGAQGSGYASVGWAAPATEMMIESPPSGDIELSIRCFTGDEERGADAQVITVNADAPDPKPEESQ